MCPTVERPPSTEDWQDENPNEFSVRKQAGNDVACH